MSAPEPETSPTKLLLGGLAIAAIVALAIGAAFFSGGDGRRTSPLVGRVAPTFELPLVAGTGAGDRVSLEALRGEVVALDFWASWCGPCRMSIPVLNRVHDRYGSRVHMYGLNVESQVPPAAVVDAHRSFGALFPTLQDQGYRAQADYQVQSIPTLVLIDRQGTIRYLHTGVPDEDDVGDVLDELLATTP
ncbi:MAG: TlpA family protein disulfide reductase [Sandaracinaceae bacterium]